MKNNDVIELKVIPNSSKTELIQRGGLVLYLKAVPEKGKANEAIIKFFKKELKLKVEIISGLKSRKKKLRVIK